MSKFPIVDLSTSDVPRPPHPAFDRHEVIEELHRISDDPPARPDHDHPISRRTQLLLILREAFDERQLVRLRTRNNEMTYTGMLDKPPPYWTQFVELYTLTMPPLRAHYVLLDDVVACTLEDLPAQPESESTSESTGVTGGRLNTDVPFAEEVPRS